MDHEPVELVLLHPLPFDGADDTAPMPSVNEEMAQRAQHGELRVIPGCGHYVPIERPDALVAILDEVLTRTNSGS